MKQILLTILLLFSLQTFAQTLENDRLALVAIYNSMGGSEWYKQPIHHDVKWVVPGTPGDNPCGWDGVTCAQVDGQTRIVGLATGEGITGTIPPEIGNLTALKDLGFVGDEGPFVFHPPLGGKIPVELATLPNLENLTLVNNIFDQESVELLFTMTKLKNLTYTPLSPLPDAIGNLVNLETLSLYGYNSGVLAKSENNGPIPKTIGNLTKLTSLYIQDAGFEGPIPAEVGNLINLKTLSIAGMTNGGSIPSEIGNLPSIRFITLKNNQHSGTIPASFNKLINIGEIVLIGNQLAGPIPDLSALPNNLINVSINNLNFDQLEPNTSRFSLYGGQKLLKLTKTKNVLSVYAGGTLARNTYRWYHSGSLVATIIGDSTYEMTQTGSYHVVVTNSIATKVSLKSETFESALPVTLVSFEVTSSNNQNNLNWKTSSETNNKAFEIEKSADARTFTKIGYVEGNGDSKELNIYDFTDPSPFNITYYRLKQLDYDDTFEYSKIIMAKSARQVSIYPNPAKDHFNVTGLAKEENISVISQSGNVVLRQKIGVDGSINTATILNGIYQVEVGGTTKKLLILK